MFRSWEWVKLPPSQSTGISEKNISELAEKKSTLSQAPFVISIISHLLPPLSQHHVTCCCCSRRCLRMCLWHQRTQTSLVLYGKKISARHMFHDRTYKSWELLGLPKNLCYANFSILQPRFFVCLSQGGERVLIYLFESINLASLFCVAWRDFLWVFNCAKVQTAALAQPSSERLSIFIFYDP